MAFADVALIRNCLLRSAQEMEAFIVHAREENTLDHSGKGQAGSVRPAQGNVLDDLFTSGLPAHELSVPRLQNETMGLLAAGIQTTKTALALASYHILENTTVHQRLFAELKSSIPDASKVPALPELEKLPYLNACVEEGE